jgi:hypothetical protein
MIIVHNTIAARPPHHPYRPPLGDSGETRVAHLHSPSPLLPPELPAGSLDGGQGRWRWGPSSRPPTHPVPLIISFSPEPTSTISNGGPTAVLAGRRMIRHPSCVIYNFRCWIWSFAPSPHLNTTTYHYGLPPLPPLSPPSAHVSGAPSSIIFARLAPSVRPSPISLWHPGNPRFGRSRGHLRGQAGCYGGSLLLLSPADALAACRRHLSCSAGRRHATLSPQPVTCGLQEAVSAGTPPLCLACSASVGGGSPPQGRSVGATVILAVFGVTLDLVGPCFSCRHLRGVGWRGRLLLRLCRRRLRDWLEV